MATDREIVCEFYKWETQCSKRGEGTFRKACQTCKKYKPKKGSFPARKNLKKQKTRKIYEQDIRNMIKEY